MASITWLTVLINELAMADGFAAELDRQLCAQARSLAGIDLAKGYALLPPDDGFVVRFQTIGPAVLGIVDGYLVDPKAEGHPVTLGWRSRTTPDRKVEPSDRGDEVEFAWLELPVAELSSRTRADTPAVSARFPVEWNVDTWTSVRLRWRARQPFSAADQAALTTAIAGALRAWNAGTADKIHYVSEPEVAADRTEIAFYVDLGPAGADGVVALINAVAASPLADAIARVAVGLR